MTGRNAPPVPVGISVPSGSPAGAPSARTTAGRPATVPYTRSATPAAVNPAATVTVAGPPAGGTLRITGPVAVNPAVSLPATVAGRATAPAGVVVVAISAPVARSYPAMITVGVFGSAAAGCQAISTWVPVTASTRSTGPAPGGAAGVTDVGAASSVSVHQAPVSGCTTSAAPSRAIPGVVRGRVCTVRTAPPCR